MNVLTEMITPSSLKEIFKDFWVTLSVSEIVTGEVEHENCSKTCEKRAHKGKSQLCH